MALRSLGLRVKGIDYPLLLTVAILLVFGLVMVYSASFGLALQNSTVELPRATAYYLVRQLQWVGIGTVAMVFMALVDYQAWRRWAIPILGGVFLILVALLLMRTGEEEAQRWLLGNSVQPSEICKLGLIIYISAWLASKGEKIRQLTYGMIPFAILLGIVTGLIVMQPNYSTAFLIIGMAIAMFFVAGADVAQLLIGFVVGGASLALLVRSSSYHWNRVLTFVASPLSDPLGDGYQIARAIFALQSGGLTGVGLGDSVQKMGYLFAAHTDAIFAVIGEELGLIGGLGVIALYGILGYRGFHIAAKCRDPFGTLLAIGVTSWFVLQAALHIGVVTATAPPTGITLPFVSFGGSSLVSCMAGVGLLLSVSRGSQGEYAR